ncbi:Lsr2 family protein [Pseudonocardia alni]|uniref:histone-like nucleoid-structuring protein Lsr2 n=1 Tax=Pseudonocardia alni TaxID=33907 RepID=UPI00280C315F|nr:Lsr2 family protein [Pseudonocardia alni]
MARIEQIRLVDDLDGGSADETIEFTVNNVAYEIDLNEAHAAELRDTLAPYIAAARRASSDVGRPRRARAAAAAAMTAERRQHNNAIRAWARQNGYPIADRGRIPVEIVDAFDKNAGSGTAPAPRSTSTPSVPQFQEAG